MQVMIPSNSSRQYAWNRFAIIILVAVFILVLLTFSDYGVTWDEDVHDFYGNLVLDYYLSGFRDQRALSWMNLYLYGAAFDMSAAALERVFQFGTYPTRHLLNGIIGVVGLVGTWKLGRQVGGPRTGFLAVLLLATIPNYYGQMFNNPKDIPFAAANVWALYYICRIVSELPRPKLSLVLRFGTALGLALGVRIGALLLVGYASIAIVIYTVRAGSPSGTGERRIVLLLSTALRTLAPALALAFPVMLLFWPWAQLDPLRNPLKSLDYFGHVTFPFMTLFAGQYYPAENLPRTYLPTFIALALPELTLVLALAALFHGVRIALWPGRENRTKSLQYMVLGSAVVVPIGYAVGIRAVLFDGMRHFLFVLPPIATAAALSGNAAIDWIITRQWRAPIFALLGLYTADHLAIMYLLHPDQYVYYNGLVGGVAGAQTLFKTDYWANSYREAVQDLVAYLKRQYGPDFDGQHFSVYACGPPISAAAFFPPSFVFEPDRNRADFVIAFTKDDCDKSFGGREIARVERMGALLSRVFDQRSRP
jgi:Dolichyl-phosphate-mannose-protein mannosyltransferase